LNLYNNNITKIENIPGNVIELYLYKNNIKVIENIPNGVKELDLSHNNIEVINNIPNSVTNLYLKYNPIEKQIKKDESHIDFSKRIIKQNKLQAILEL